MNRRNFLSAATAAGLAHAALFRMPAITREPILTPDDQMFLRQQASAILDASRITDHKVSMIGGGP